LNQYVVSLKDNPAKQVLSQRDLKTQSAISVPAAGFVAIGAKADGIYSRTESGVEKDS
jgi:hypothetical protein